MVVPWTIRSWLY